MATTKTVLRLIRPSLMFVLLATVIFGLVYPVIVTLILQAMVPNKAFGSLLVANGRVIGSALIGQSFSQGEYFWGRPSATTPFPYNALQSSASNLSCANSALMARIKTDVERLGQAHHPLATPIPIDLLTTSASGLDPDISVAGAYFQIPRVVKARKLSAAKELQLRKLVDEMTQPRQGYLLGEPRINVLKLNLAMDQLLAEKES